MAERKCGDTRPAEAGEETKLKKVQWDLEKIPEDMPVSIVVYPGCIEGDRVPYSLKGAERQVLASGTAKQIAEYTIGLPVTIGTETYERNIGRKAEDAVRRIKEEMTGEGDIAAMAREQKGEYAGYKLTANGQVVTKDSLLNPLFRRMFFFTNDEGRPELRPEDKLTGDEDLILRNGKQVCTMGGVELEVTAIINQGGLEQRMYQ